MAEEFRDLMLIARQVARDLLDEAEHFLNEDLVADYRERHEWLGGD